MKKLLLLLLVLPTFSYSESWSCSYKDENGRGGQSIFKRNGDHFLWINSFSDITDEKKFNIIVDGQNKQSGNRTIYLISDNHYDHLVNLVSHDKVNGSIKFVDATGKWGTIYIGKCLLN